MRNIWLIPDRNQDGLTYAIDGEKVAPLNELIALKLFPPELVLGIPEEILRKGHLSDFLYAQAARLPNGENKNEKLVFCISAPAGLDKAGRVVCITNLQLLSSGEHPMLPPEQPSDLQPDLKVWTKVFNNKESASYSPVFQMLEALQKHSTAKTFSSGRVQKSRFPPDWMPQKKSFSLLLFVACTFVLVLIYFVLLPHIRNY